MSKLISYCYTTRVTISGPLRYLGTKRSKSVRNNSHGVGICTLHEQSGRAQNGGVERGIPSPEGRPLPTSKCVGTVDVALGIAHIGTVVVLEVVMVTTLVDQTRLISTLSKEQIGILLHCPLLPGEGDIRATPVGDCVDALRIQLKLKEDPIPSITVAVHYVVSIHLIQSVVSWPFPEKFRQV